MKKSIVVLGIHDGHNVGAALVKNGSVVAAIQEERLVNEKNYSGTLRNSVRKVFEVSTIPPEDVNLIAIAGLVRIHAPLKERPLHVRLYERFAFLFKGHKMNKFLINQLQNILPFIYSKDILSSC